MRVNQLAGVSVFGNEHSLLRRRHSDDDLVGRAASYLGDREYVMTSRAEVRMTAKSQLSSARN
jgi:hypothetical protein